MARTDNGWNNGPGTRRRQADFAVPPQLNSASPQSQQAADKGGAVLEYWQLIKRRKRVVFLTAVLGALGAFVDLVIQQPIYSTSTTVELQGLNTNFMNLSAVDPLAGNYAVNKENISTEIKIIMSGSIRRPVLDRLFRETAPATPPKHGMLAPLRAFFRGKEDPLVEMRNGLMIAAFSLKAQPIIGTRIITISTESTIPEIATSYVNTVVQEYQNQSAQQRTLSSQRTSQWLETQLEEARVKVEQAESRLQDFARKSGGAFVGEEKETLASSKLRDLQQQLSGLQSDRISKQARYEQIKASPSDSLPGIVDDLAYKQFQSKLTDLRQDLAKLNQTLTPANPKVQKVQDQITEITAQMQAEKDSILQRYKNDYESVLKHEQLLSSAYAGAAGTVSGQSDKVAQYQQLKREVDLYQGSLNGMLAQVNQSAVASALPTGNIRVIDAAGVPGIPYKPQAQTYELYGVVLGAGAGVFLILAINQLSTWRSSLIFGMPGYSPRVLNVPELGVIPSIGSGGPVEVSSRRWSRLLPSSGANRVPAAPAVLLSATTDGSIQAESFRLALTSILLMSHGGRQPKIIVVTSPGPGEGKTTVVSNMAIAVAESGRKVLIIDADLRRPRIHTIFGIETNEGFGELMTYAKSNGKGSGRRAPTVCQTQIDGVFVLPSGTTGDVNLGQVFHSPEIPALLDKLTKEFDLILIDTPPMIHFSDARLMARFADGLILVVRSGVTARDAAIAARDQLAQDNINVLGTILNDWDARANLRSPYQPYQGSYTAYHKTPSEG